MEENSLENLKGLRENISLKDYTTFKIGGKARYFYCAETEEGLIEAVSAAAKTGMDFFILGAGSNLLASDDGFFGLVIKANNRKLSIKNSEKGWEIVCGSGTPLSFLLSELLRVGAAGMEWAAGIPGTVGGAICGNAGTKDGEMGDSIKDIKVFDLKENKIKNLGNKDCGFSYRKSIFKENKNLIIISARLEFKKGKKEDLKETVMKILGERTKKYPNLPSAGSVFMNPEGFSAGELIEKCGLKGKIIGEAQISEKHANFIANLGQAKAVDVECLISLAKKEVKDKFNVNLNEEIIFFPEKNKK